MIYPDILGNPRDALSVIFEVCVGVQVNDDQVNTWSIDGYAKDKKHARQLVKGYKDLPLFIMSIKMEE